MTDYSPDEIMAWRHWAKEEYKKGNIDRELRDWIIKKSKIALRKIS